SKLGRTSIVKTVFRRAAVLAAIAALSACVPTRRPELPAPTTVGFESSSWSQLPGWRADDALAAWPALINSCIGLRAKPEWQAFCSSVAATSPMDADSVRGFLEQQLQPYRVLRVTGHKVEKTGLVTGYFEPL